MSNSGGLVSSLHRTSIVRTIPQQKAYADFILPAVHDAIEAWTGRSWNRQDSKGLAEFLAFLQHNGFPTPLLDWSFSPYVAAYFAYSGVNHFHCQDEDVAIFSLNQHAWCAEQQQFYDFADFRPHVSFLTPREVGNQKMLLQQGCFTYSSVVDVGKYICDMEAVEGCYLKKYELPASERPRVIHELKLMGISAVHLMPSVESVCKKALEDLIGLIPVEGQTSQSISPAAPAAIRVEPT